MNTSEGKLAVLKIHEAPEVAIKYSVTKLIFYRTRKYSRISFNVP